MMTTRGGATASPLGEKIESNGDEQKPHKLSVPSELADVGEEDSRRPLSTSYEGALCGMAKGGIRYVAAVVA